MNHDFTYISLHLDILERAPALSNARAVELLCSEFALALNASSFAKLSADDIAVHVGSRATAPDGIARYEVILELVERNPAMTDEQAEELLRREFRRALNASHFRRICLEDFRVTLLARDPADAIAA